MAPKPASTAGKAPVSTTSKAPKEGSKATKKTRADAPAEGEKKKRRKVRKETYSSYIYKGQFSAHAIMFNHSYHLMANHYLFSPQTGSP
jgi:hypothetical protein